MDFFGTPVERGIIIKVTEAGARVASQDRPGIVTMPLKPMFRKAMEVGWPVFFVEYESGQGLVISHINPDISRDEVESGLPGMDGKSAYELWLEAGNTGTVEDFLLSLIGANGSPGADGKSAYQIWLDNGHTGTVADFLFSLIGPQGPAGSNATVTREAVEAVLTGEISSHKHDNSYVKKSGDTMTGKLIAPRLRATATTDVASGAANDVAFIAGDEAGAHIAMDGNEIMAKLNGTTAGPLYLNSDGGDVYANLKKLWHQGNLKILQGFVAMDITTGGTTVNKAIDLESAGFTSAPVVLLTVRTSAPNLFALSTSTPTATGFTLYLYRASGTGTTYVSWLAIGE